MMPKGYEESRRSKVSVASQTVAVQSAKRKVILPLEKRNEKMELSDADHWVSVIAFSPPLGKERLRHSYSEINHSI